MDGRGLGLSPRMADQADGGNKSPKLGLMDLRNRAKAAEQDVPPGRLGGLVIQQRYRARIANGRAILVLCFLILTIFGGLAYYIGRPLLATWADGRRATYNEQIRKAETDSQALDERREVLRQSLADLLSLAGTRSTARPRFRFLAITALKETETLIALTLAGTISRSADSGKTWVEVYSANNLPLFSLESFDDGKTLIATGFRGVILRSTDAGVTWIQRPSNTDQNLRPLIILEDGRTLFGFGRAGTIIRSNNAGETWGVLNSGTITSLNAFGVINQGKILVAGGNDGTIVRSTDAGETWATVPSGTDQPIRAISVLADDKSLVALAGHTGIVRSGDAGATWNAVPPPTTRNLTALKSLGDGSTVIAVGSDGVVVRSIDRGDTWTVTSSGTNKDLHAISVLEDEKTLAAVGEGGVIIHSADAGENWTLAPSEGTEDFTSLVPFGSRRALIALEFGGSSFFVIDERLGRELADVPISKGAEGDAALGAFLAQLSKEVQRHDGVSSVDKDLNEIIGQRLRVDGSRAAAVSALTELASGELTQERRQQAFVSFMESCRETVEASTEVTVACANTYAALQTDQSVTWWAALAEQVPPGILLLFLLATLGGLYRYNLRLAGFHHSRADALEILTEHVNHGALGEISDALAADKVEFGRARTPADQVTEIARAVAARK